jgi:DNA-binding IclR family transcriptional regulator
MPRKSATPSLSERDAAPGGVAAVDRAMSLLSVFRAGEEPLTLAQLAERSSLHKSTVLRLLASLAHAMLVERLPDGRYALGRGIVRLNHVHQASSSLERVVMPALRELVQATGESAALHAQWGSGATAQRISLFRVDSPQPIRDHYKVGDILPMNGGTGARVLIAFGADSVLANAATTRPSVTGMPKSLASAPLSSKPRRGKHTWSAHSSSPCPPGVTVKPISPLSCK